MKILNHYFYFFLKLSLESKTNMVHIPIIPQPKIGFQKVQFLKKGVSFDYSSSLREFRNFIFARVGMNIKFQKKNIQIINVKVTNLQKAQNKSYGFIQKWNQIFQKTGYKWEDNPIIWSIQFDYTPEPITVQCSNDDYIEKNNILKLPLAMIA